jgi:hypothetical protein
MSLFSKPLSQVTETDLETLLIDRQPEGRTLDYKRDPVGRNDGDKKEFLYDASSFANTQGGHLIFGIDEAGGEPTASPGVSGIDAEQEILRLEQLLRDGIRPSLSGVETVPVTLSNGNVALVMRIPKSWNPPHQVTFQKAFRFYARDSNGKYQVDVDELRAIFAVSGAIADRIREFRVERVTRIAAGNTPVTLLDRGVLVLHVVPFAAFGPGTAFPLDQAAREPHRFPTLRDNYARQFQVTFDGLLTTSNAQPPPQPQRAYTQLLRTGAVEAVASSLASGSNGDWLILPQLEAMIIGYARLYAQALHAFGVAAPIAVMASLTGVRGMKILQDFPPHGAMRVDMPSIVLPQHQFHFVEAILETIPPDDKAAARQLHTTLNHLANAAGLAASPFYDANGNYTRRISLGG